MSQAIWRSWKPETLKKAIVADLASNGEIAGKFVEGEARRRLLSVREPDWGAAYRAYVANYLLTSLVEVTAQAVIVWVGVKVGKEGSQHGLWIELGTRPRTIITKAGKRRRIPGYPPHPYLRPAVFDNARQLLLLLAGR